MPGLSGACTISVPESVCACLIFLRIASGSSSMYTSPASVPLVVDIWRRALQVHDARPKLGDHVRGLDKQLPVGGVEAPRDLAGELDVLALVVSTGTSSVL